MGNTIGRSERLRVTLGFEPSSGPPPTALPGPGTPVVLLTGGAGMVVGRVRLRARRS